VIIDGEDVAVRFGDAAVNMPPPIARDIRTLLAGVRPISVSNPWRVGRGIGWTVR